MLPITSITAALAALALLKLSITVIKRRRGAQAALGTAGDKRLEAAIRAQGNFTEYTPMFLILLALLELAAFPTLGLIALALLFATGRTLHALSLLKFETYDEQGKLNGVIKYRVAGMMMTFFALLIGAVSLLIWVTYKGIE